MSAILCHGLLSPSWDRLRRDECKKETRLGGAQARDTIWFRTIMTAPAALIDESVDIIVLEPGKKPSNLRAIEIPPLNREKSVHDIIGKTSSHDPRWVPHNDSIRRNIL